MPLLLATNPSTVIPTKAVPLKGKVLMRTRTACFTTSRMVALFRRGYKPSTSYPIYLPTWLGQMDTMSRGLIGIVRDYRLVKGWSGKSPADLLGSSSIVSIVLNLKKAGFQVKQWFEIVRGRESMSWEVSPEP
jgi:hypothetical protein